MFRSTVGVLAPSSISARIQKKWLNLEFSGVSMIGRENEEHTLHFPGVIVNSQGRSAPAIASGCYVNSQGKFQGVMSNPKESWPVQLYVTSCSCKSDSLQLGRP